MLILNETLQYIEDGLSEATDTGGLEPVQRKRFIKAFAKMQVRLKNEEIAAKSKEFSHFLKVIEHAKLTQEDADSQASISMAFGNK